jgi:hypothetical protein
MYLIVGQPILAGVPSGDGFQPALAGIEHFRMPGKSRLKRRQQAKLPAPQNRQNFGPTTLDQPDRTEAVAVTVPATVS